jgi:hypothetical protein
MGRRLKGFNTGRYSIKLKLMSTGELEEAFTC